MTKLTIKVLVVRLDDFARQRGLSGRFDAEEVHAVRLIGYVQLERIVTDLSIHPASQYLTTRDVE